MTTDLLAHVDEMDLVDVDAALILEQSLDLRKTPEPVSLDMPWVDDIEDEYR